MYHSKEIKEILKEFDSDLEKGLSEEKARALLGKYGPNKLKEKKKKNLLLSFLEQFREFLIVILILAALVSAILLQEYIDSAAIFFIVLLNGSVAFYQEYRAEQAMEALKKLASPKARAIRAGKVAELDTTLLVPGDIVLLEAGDKIPADLRIVESYSLKIDEAILTGESAAVSKKATTLSESTFVSDRKNMVFSGTTVVYGKGKGIVIGTGMNTEIGKIAKMVGEVEEEQTPLQKKMEEFGKKLGTLILAICAFIFISGSLIGVEGKTGPALYAEMFLIAVTLAVAAIPEGLPAAITIALSLGMKRMADRNAIVRKLSAVETLGSTSIICSDKTGTLTKNKMEVREIFAGKKGNEELAILCGVLCNNAKLEENIGDGTEIALLKIAKEKGMLSKADSWKRFYEIPFDSETKRMGVIAEGKEGIFLFEKGAAEVILHSCGIGENEKKEMHSKNESMANKALRVLAFAYKKLEGDKESIIKKAETTEGKKELECNLEFLGLMGMIDPPREEVLEAIKKCKDAHIRVVMITGDHITTAKAIAHEIGIHGEAITGAELDKIPDGEYEKRVENIAIYARVLPEQKLRIVSMLKKKDYVVAMTGDGVNDAPALKKSDIGIAMGITGTEVAKEASDIILTDDNFASIVNAIEEGRIIYDNIKKFIYYLLGCNIGEVIAMFAATLLRLPLPLFPIQILWMNLVTDGLPALGLAVEPAEKNIMKREPNNPKEDILKTKMGFLILTGLIVGFGTLALFYYSLPRGEDEARTIAFTTIILFQMFAAILFKSFAPLSMQSLFSNKKLLLAIFSSVLLHIAVLYLIEPALSASGTPVFKTVPLPLEDWLLIIPMCSSVLIIGEAMKRIKGFGK